MKYESTLLGQDGSRGQGHSSTFVQGIIFGTSVELNETGSHMSVTVPLASYCV